MSDYCNHWLGHRWERWSDPVPRQNDDKYMGLQQHRHCDRCGMVQYYHVIAFVPVGAP